MKTYITMTAFQTKEFFNRQEAVAHLQLLTKLGIDAKLLLQDLSGKVVELFSSLDYKSPELKASTL